MILRNSAHITHLIYFFTGTAAGTLGCGGCCRPRPPGRRLGSAGAAMGRWAGREERAGCRREPDESSSLRLQAARDWSPELLGAVKGEEGWGPGQERVMSKIAQYDY